MTTYCLLHGFLGAPESWRLVIAALPKASRCATPALFGHSPHSPWAAPRTPGSPRAPRTLPAAPERGSFAAEAGRLAALVAALPPPVHLVGYSLGARLALGMLVLHPALWQAGPLARATLVGVHPGLADAGERRARRRADDEWARRFEHEPIARVLDAWLAQPVFAGLAERVGAERLAHEQARRARLPARRIAAALRGLSLGRMPDLRRSLSGLRLPVALVAGARDRRFAAHARNLARVLPAGTVHLVAGAGHNVPLEAPAALARLLRAPRSRLLTHREELTA